MRFDDYILLAEIKSNGRNLYFSVSFIIEAIWACFLPVEPSAPAQLITQIDLPQDRNASTSSFSRISPKYISNPFRNHIILYFIVEEAHEQPNLEVISFLRNDLVLLIDASLAAF